MAGQDKKTLKRINTLIEAARRNPFAGIGKPEPLLGDLATVHNNFKPRLARISFNQKTNFFTLNRPIAHDWPAQAAINSVAKNCQAP